MSSCPTEKISTTGSWSSCPFPVEILVCGALAAHVREIVQRRGWPVTVWTLPAVLHNHPRKIAEYAQRRVLRAQAANRSVVVAYADCGTYGALDAVCERYGVKRLPGLHCYDLFAGPERVAELFAREPGTYLLTDFLVRSFGRLVLAELGLDRHPELWDDYFGHYRRVVWLTQEPTAELATEAERIAAMFGLPLTRVCTGTGRLERELEALLP